MISAWTKHIKDEEDKKKFQNSIIGARHVLGRLEELLNEEETASDRSETDIKGYDLPNWEYRQAHRNGYRSAIKIVKTLINLDTQEIKHS